MTVKHTSWGRTRSPKNLVGNRPGQAVTVLANTNSMLGSAAGYKLVGYATENQRYLHVLLTDAHSEDPSGAPLKIFGYCHAFERWFEIPQSQAAGGGANTALTATSFAVADSGAADTAQVPSDREYRVYEILGIDRVAFVGNDSLVNVYAACSTF